ncbi:hypothetical protein EDC19_1208 [Natranaerovirga hydrolytica]|uniref:Uncharacterized protein n=1 Tax=Natranaerovirga hydrolytica TaxID=680378 RepID=A0A4R1N7X2_9FIRM|nr:hypothetical protein [Natranaerovirga hydrolytica]TCK98773.1 hypothetical protein EDC19_1208 [Natranaerovirga hydrolytica]
MNELYNVVFVKEGYFRNNKNFIEMLDHNKPQKQSRRHYVFLQVQYKNNNILIPLRSKLRTNKGVGVIGFPVPSEKLPDAGLDYRKMLIINDTSYIEKPKHTRIPKSQQKILQNNYHKIKEEVTAYIKGYIKSALKNREKKDKKYIFSSLHNYHQELGILEVLEAREEAASTKE